MGQLKLITSLVLIGLFTLAVIGFAINFAEDNDVPANLRIGNDADVIRLKAGVTGNVSSASNDANDTYYSIKGTEITTADTSPTASAFVLTPLSAVSVVRTILQVAYVRIFGSDQNFAIFITSFIALLTLAIALFVWQTWKGGSP
jgi:hypothetical protein